MNKLFNKALAVVLAGTMVIGASVTAFADDINGATGAGESTGHLDTTVCTAVLPTSSVDGTFAFTVDPENILAKAGKIKGTTAVTSNTDKVYFANSGGGYSSTSDAVPLGAKNYADAQVSVKATAALASADSDKTMMPLATSAEDLAAATVPTLLLTLKIAAGSSDTTPATGIVVAGTDGVTVKKDIAGQPDNFDVAYASGKYTLEPKSSVTSWSSVDVTLSGKVGGTYESVAENVAAPAVTLTWTVAAKPTDAAPSIATTTYNLAAGTAVAVTTNFGSGASAATSITGVKKPDGDLLSASSYTISSNTITFTATWVDKVLAGMNSGDSKKYKVVFNTGDEVELTFTKP